MTDDGGFVVAWQDNNQDGSGWGAYVQRYDASGNPLGGEFRANTYASNSQYGPAVAYGSGGRFLVAWTSDYQDGSGSGVYGQLYGGGIAKADLEPTTASTAGGWNLNQGMLVNGAIRNQGLAASGTFTAQYYLSADTTITTADTPLGDAFTVADLAAMTTLGDSRWVAVPAVAAGDYYVGLIVDTGNAVDEQDETNNTYSPLFTDRTFNLAALPDLGPEGRVNTVTANDQQSVDVAFDGSGNYVAVWESSGQDGGGWGIYGQRYNAAGEQVGLAFRVNTTTAGDQLQPSVAIAADGSFIVAWSGPDASGRGVYAQHYNAAGDAVGTEFRVNTYTTNDQDEPSVAADGSGNFLVVWQSYGQDSGSNGGIYGQRYNADGTANGGEFWVTSSGSPNQQRPHAAMNATGQFAVAWDDNSTVWVRAFQANGTARGDEFKVHDYDDNQQYLPSVGIADNGDFVVAWDSWGPDGSEWAAQARRFAADGTPQGDEFTVNTRTTTQQGATDVSMNAAGDFLIAWHSYQQDGSSYGVYGQRFASAGGRVGGEFRLNTQTNSEQLYPSVAYRSANDFVALWQSQGQDGSGYGIYQQRAGVNSVNSRPNLVVTQNQVPGTIDLNATVDVQVTVTNTGIAVAPPSTLKLFLSDDNAAGDDVDLNTSVQVPMLMNELGGNTFQTTLSFTMPATDPIGTDRYYFVLALADADAQVLEANESDNLLASNQTHLLMADLQFSQLAIPSQVEPGQEVEVQITVVNYGDANAAASVGHLWLSDDNVAGNADDRDLFIDFNVPELVPYTWPNYTTFQTTARFTWPEVDPFGTDRSYYVVGELDVTDLVVEFSETNNTRASNSTFLIMPDLRVDFVDGPDAVPPGEEVSYDVRIRNHGEKAAPASKFRVYLSDDGVGGNADDVYLDLEVDVPALGTSSSDEYFDATITFTWPVSDPFGTDLLYYVAVQADVGGAVRESREDNNWGFAGPIELMVPDLTLPAVVLPTTMSAGMELNALLTVRNAGAEGVPQPATGRVFLSDNAVAGDGDDVDLGVTFEIPPLWAGAQQDLLVGIPLPGVDPIGSDGEYYFLFVADAPDEIYEGREDNNTLLSASVAWAVPLDLTVPPRSPAWANGCFRWRRSAARRSARSRWSTSI